MRPWSLFTQMLRMFDGLFLLLPLFAFCLSCHTFFLPICDSFCIVAILFFGLVCFVTLLFRVFFVFVFHSIVEFFFWFGYLQSVIFLGSFHSVYCIWCVLNLQYILRLFSLAFAVNRLFFFFCDGSKKKMPWWLCSILKGFLEHWTFHVCVSHAKIQLWISLIFLFVFAFAVPVTVTTLSHINW